MNARNCHRPRAKGATWSGSLDLTNRAWGRLGSQPSLTSNRGTFGSRPEVPGSCAAYFSFQSLDPISQIFEPTFSMYVEPVQDLHGVVISVLGSNIARHALDVLTDHDDGQQYQLEECLRNPRDEALSARPQCWW